MLLLIQTTKPHKECDTCQTNQSCRMTNPLHRDLPPRLSMRSPKQIRRAHPKWTQMSLKTQSADRPAATHACSFAPEFKAWLTAAQQITLVMWLLFSATGLRQRFPSEWSDDGLQNCMPQFPIFDSDVVKEPARSERSERRKNIDRRTHSYPGVPSKVNEWRGYRCRTQ